MKICVLCEAPEAFGPWISATAGKQKERLGAFLLVASSIIFAELCD